MHTRFNNRRFLSCGKHSGQRAERGSFLIEAIISVLIASILATSLVQMYAQTKRATTGSQTQIMAIALAQSCVDALRAKSYATVSGAADGTFHYPRVTSNTAGTGDPLFPYPLLADAVALSYQDPMHPNQVLANAPTQFRARTDDGVDNAVKVRLSQAGGLTNSTLVEVWVRWADGSGWHSYKTTSILCSTGLNG